MCDEHISAWLFDMILCIRTLTYATNVNKLHAVILMGSYMYSYTVLK